MTRTRSQTVDIGHGRGRLAPAPAASILRIDKRLGRPADVNSAWRASDLQQRMFEAWQAYVAGRGPRPNHGRALPPSQSVHCDGEAADSDDWYDPAAAAVWRLGGWRQTADDEKWHGEYFPSLDRLAGAPAGSGSKPIIPTIKELEMATIQDVKHICLKVPGQEVQWAIVGAEVQPQGVSSTTKQKTANAWAVLYEPAQIIEDADLWATIIAEARALAAARLAFLKAVNGS